jgi:hypothetical protein
MCLSGTVGKSAGGGQSIREVSIMPAAISAVSTAASQSSAASAAQSREQQELALNRMLVTYARDQSHGSDPATLSSLGKQITAAAKVLGQHVTLPKASTSAVQSPPARAAGQKGRVSVTA